MLNVSFSKLAKCYTFITPSYWALNNFCGVYPVTKNFDILPHPPLPHPAHIGTPKSRWQFWGFLRDSVLYFEFEFLIQYRKNEYTTAANLYRKLYLMSPQRFISSVNFIMGSGSFTWRCIFQIVDMAYSNSVRFSKAFV